MVNFLPSKIPEVGLHQQISSLMQGLKAVGVYNDTMSTGFIDIWDSVVRVE